MANTRKIQIASRDRFSIQTGTIPAGVTSSGSKYPINSADISIDNPNQYYGPTQTPLVGLQSINSNFELILADDWSGKIKTGDPVQIQRGNIHSEYVIQSAIYNPGTTATNITLSNKRDVVHLLDPYISDSGYDTPSYDTYIDLGRRVESPNSPDFTLVKAFSVKMVPTSNPDVFSLETAWQVDPLVSATRIRWRSVPRNTPVSNLTFDIQTQGDYSQIPSAVVNSPTGRKAEIQLTGTVYGLTIAAGGTGYSTISAVVTGGGGTGASLTASISGSALSSLSIASGGTAYSSVPSIVITGDGTGASAYFTKMKISGVYVVQQGGNYLSAPSVSIDSTYQMGLTAAEVGSYLFLMNSGRVDYLRVAEGGTGYTGASVSITGSSYGTNATAVAEITDGAITNIVLTNPGHGYNGATSQPVVTITPAGTGGTGASAIANTDIFSNWVYEDAEGSNVFSKTITGFKYNIPYEIEILAAQDEHFRGLVRYTNTSFFQYYK